MTSVHVQCHKCNKVFTPYGLAQHASKSQNACCRASNNPSHYQLVTLPIPHAAHPPGPYQISASGDLHEPLLGDKYDLASGQGSNNVSDLGGHSSTGVFIIIHVPKQDGDIFLSYITIWPFFFTVDNTHEINVDTIETPDPANIADADTFKELTQPVNFSSRRAINHTLVNNPPDDLKQAQQQANPIKAGTFGTGAIVVVIDCFLSECAGTPIPGIPQRLSWYESHQATHGASAWAPFQSQCNWEVTHWVKSSSATSLAVTKLLAIPEVSLTFVLDFCVTKWEAKCYHAVPCLVRWHTR